MSAPEPHPAKAETPAPSTEMRLCWWFTIYSAGQVPILLYGFNPAVLLFFPGLLGMPVAIIVNALPETAQQPAAMVLLPIGMAAGYIFYIWHLYKSLRAPTRRQFYKLLLLLVIAVLANQSMLRALGPISR